MGLVAVRLDDETEAHLADILVHDKTDRSELIRRLINDRWVSLQAGKLTVAERMGREPHLFDGPSDLSERGARKRYIAKQMLGESDSSYTKKKGDYAVVEVGEKKTKPMFSLEELSKQLEEEDVQMGTERESK